MLVQTLWDQRMGPLYRGLERKLEYPKMAAEAVREHPAIVSTLVRRDPRAARSAMRRHMDATHKRYTNEWSVGN